MLGCACVTLTLDILRFSKMAPTSSSVNAPMFPLPALFLSILLSPCRLISPLPSSSAISNSVLSPLICSAIKVKDIISHISFLMLPYDLNVTRFWTVLADRQHAPVPSPLLAANDDIHGWF